MSNRVLSVVGTLLALSAIMLFILSGCGGDSPHASSPLSPHQAAAKERVAELCAESRVEGMHLPSCKAFYEIRDKEASER